MSKAISNKGTFVLGIISDTHGTLTRQAAKTLNNVDLIIHAGDIDTPNVLKTLRSIAPVIAVRGNMDKGGWTKKLTRTEVVEVGNVSIYVIHDVNGLDLDPAKAGFKVVVSGHTHRPSIKKKEGILYVNPGSAWWPRSGSPTTLAIVTVQEDKLSARLVDLKT